MTAKQARRLLRGTVVMRDGDKDNLGTVRELGIAGFFVDWERGDRGWIYYVNAVRIDIR